MSGAPTVTSVTASGTGIANEAGNLNVGAVVTFTVMMSAPVAVTGGTPTFALNDNGGVATYTGGSGNELTFSYTVAAGQDTPTPTTGTPGLAITGYNANGATVSTGNPTLTP